MLVDKCPKCRSRLELASCRVYPFHACIYPNGFSLLDAKHMDTEEEHVVCSSSECDYYGALEYTEEEA